MNKLLKLLGDGKNEEAKKILFGEFEDARHSYLNAVNDIIKYHYKLVNNSASVSNDEVSTATTVIYVVGFLIIVMSILFGLLITKSIVQPINWVAERVLQLHSNCITNLGKGLNLLASGDTSVMIEKVTPLLNLKYKNEIGEMAGTVDKMIDLTKNGIDAYEEVRQTIQQLTSETKKLTESSKAGLLNKRGNAEKFNGSYKELIEGINDTLDSVIEPLKEGSNVLAVLATGDLTIRVNNEFKGDYQIIKNSINQVAESLSSTIHNVSQAVLATASAANEISSSSEELASGAHEQTQQISEVARSIEEMTKTIIENTRNTSIASETAKLAGSKAQEGGEAVNNTIKGMIKIADVVKHSASTIDALGRSSLEIGEIIQVIDDIADQTNLLALNAAIEAARAGEQGRGFAVVADEVRKLAERTTNATKEIASMIKKIQMDTSEVVESMEQGNVEVEEGKKLAHQAGDVLKEIITQAIKVDDISGQVAVSSEEQSSTAEEITKTVEVINNVISQSATGTEQIAKSAEDLSRLTQNLEIIVSKFKIDQKLSIRNNVYSDEESSLQEVNVKRNGKSFEHYLN